MRQIAVQLCVCRGCGLHKGTNMGELVPSYLHVLCSLSPGWLELSRSNRVVRLLLTKIYGQVNAASSTILKIPNWNTQCCL